MVHHVQRRETLDSGTAPDEQQEVHTTEVIYAVSHPGVSIARAVSAALYEQAQMVQPSCPWSSAIRLLS